jgi:arginine decarboxylase
VLDRREFPVLLVVDRERNRAVDRPVRRIAEELAGLGHRVVKSPTYADGRALVASDPSFGCVLLDWNLTAGSPDPGARAVLEVARKRSARLPVFLMIEQGELESLPLEIAERVQECVFVFEDTPAFIAGRIDYAWHRYVDRLLPPFFGALVKFTDTAEYSWHTPGHAGGAAFRKSPAGKAFYDFYGENLFRTDLSVSVSELGSLLDHSSRVGDAERNAARIFGADSTFFVLNGTSTANQIVAHSIATAGDLVLADRNCHKSMNYALTITDAVPVYLVPARNGYGIIGPIPPAQLTPAAVGAAIAASPLLTGASERTAVYAAVTNSTYDGLCYDARRVTALLGASVPRVHFDEAWFAYARFNPLYADRYGMQPQTDQAGPTVYATQSTHKLLAAFSQASMIHIRSSERAPVIASRFNESYMMHGSTSPFYPLIAALDIAAAMMDGPAGQALTDEAILEAIHFRKRLVSVGVELAKRPGDGWFFGVWQPDEVRDPLSGTAYPFVQATDELLATDPRCWLLEPDADWHGFAGLEHGFCLLDPVKVTITTPGIDATGRQSARGVPAAVVTLFLDAQRIEIEKAGDYTILVLFSIGVSKGKWGTLLDGLLEFKRRYDANAPLRDVLPDLLRSYPARYSELGLRDLCDEMHAELTGQTTPELLDQAFGDLPIAVATPGETYRRFVRGQSEMLPLAELGGRTSAVMVVPYPPGIPLLMPGEQAGGLEGPVLRYLQALEEFDKRFPGFEHDIHGVERDAKGDFLVECLTEAAKPPQNRRPALELATTTAR